MQQMIIKPKILLLLRDKKCSLLQTKAVFLMHSNDIDMGMLLPVHP